jgi:hypothetical protein
VTYVAVLAKFKLKFVPFLDQSSHQARVAPAAATGTSFQSLALLAVDREEFAQGGILN